MSGQAQQEYNFQSWVRQDRKFSHLIILYWNNCLKFILWCYPVYDAEWDRIQWEGNYFNRNLSWKIISICLEIYKYQVSDFGIFRICSLVNVYLIINFKTSFFFTIYGADHIWLTSLGLKARCQRSNTVAWQANSDFVRNLLGLLYVKMIEWRW